jgi:hypothetical protein
MGLFFAVITQFFAVMTLCRISDGNWWGLQHGSNAVFVLLL